MARDLLAEFPIDTEDAIAPKPRNLFAEDPRDLLRKRTVVSEITYFSNLNRIVEHPADMTLEEVKRGVNLEIYGVEDPEKEFGVIKTFHPSVWQRAQRIAVQFGRGFEEMAVTSPQVVGSLIQEFGLRIEEEPDWSAIVNPLSSFNMFKLTKVFQEKVFKRTITDDAIAENGRRMIEKNKEFVAKWFPELLDREQLTGYESLARDVGGGAASLAGAIGITVLTRSPQAAAAMFGVYQKGRVFEEGLEKARGEFRLSRGLAPDATVSVRELEKIGFVDIRKLSEVSTFAGLVEGGLEFVGILSIFSRFSRSRLLNVSVKTFNESLQEFSQQTGENIVLQIGGIREFQGLQGFFEGAGRAALVGAIVGGPASLVVDQMERSGLTEDLRLKGVSQDVIDKIMPVFVAKMQAEMQPDISKVIDDYIKETDKEIERIETPGEPVIRRSVAEEIPPPKPTEAFVRQKVVKETELTQEEREAFSDLADAEEHIKLLTAQIEKVASDEAKTALRSKINVEKLVLIEAAAKKPVPKKIKLKPSEEVTLRNQAVDSLKADNKALKERGRVEVAITKERIAQRMVVLDIRRITEPGTRRLIRDISGKLAEEERIFAENQSVRVLLHREATIAARAAREAIKSIEAIKKDIANLVEARLPLALRGKFNKMIAAANNERDVSTALLRIDQDMERLQRKTTIESIKRQFNNIIKSKSIAIDFVDKARDLISGFDLVKRRATTIERLKATREFIESKRRANEDVEIPLEVLEKLEILNARPLDQIDNQTLRNIASDLALISRVGKTKLKTRRELKLLQKERDLEDLLAGSVPILERDAKGPEEPGGDITLSDNLKNRIADLLNRAQSLDLAIMPMDVAFDVMDGSISYIGPNHRIFKRTIDKAFSDWLLLKRALETEIIELVNALKMTDKQFERIGFVAARDQEGGSEKLLQLGFSQKVIDTFQLTENEQSVLDAMRKVLFDLRGPIADVMRTEYNKDLGDVTLYFPFLTDFEKMSEFEIKERFGNDVREFGRGLTGQPEKGFTLSRIKGGKQKIQIHAMEIFLKHIDNASYLLTVGKETPRLMSLASDPRYAKAVGEKGQEITRQWIDLVARKGKASAGRVGWIDNIRKNTGFAVLGYKLSSAMVQFTALLDGAALVGGVEVFNGTYNVATSKDWREFIRDNSTELRERGADDPAYIEFDDAKGNLAKFQRSGFWVLKQFDLVTASSVFAGAYEKAVKAKGEEIDLSKPDMDAIRQAELLVRRTQSSAFFKDSPPVITQGKFTGSISLDRAFFQFQSFLLNRWSVNRHDLYRIGIKQGRTPQAMNIALFMMMATMAEYGLRRILDNLLDSFMELFGFETDFGIDEDVSATKRITMTALHNIPFVSQAVSVAGYGSVPVPAFSLAEQAISAINIAVTAKKPETRVKSAIRAAILVAGVARGVPGAIQTEQIFREAAKESVKRKRKKIKFVI